jgi:hypothetical protein
MLGVVGRDALGAAARNVAQRQGVSLAPRHAVKPAYYQWRHKTKSTLCKADWTALQLADCAACGSRSWHAQWNCPEWHGGALLTLCKCCALLLEAFASLDEFRAHCQTLDANK